jgi:hypothetical protein
MNAYSSGKKVRASRQKEQGRGGRPDAARGFRASVGDQDLIQLGVVLQRLYRSEC